MTVQPVQSDETSNITIADDDLTGFNIDSFPEPYAAAIREADAKLRAVNS